VVERRIIALSVGAGFGAAFLWAAYYVFVLGLPTAADLLILVVPFVVAGLLFLLPRPGGPGGPVALLRILGSPAGWLRAVLLFAVQVDVIVATRWVGAVDASLATLLADVVATPLLVYAFYRTDAQRVRKVAFWAGVAIASAGAVLAILAGGATNPLSLVSTLVLVPLPFLIAFYFVLVNEACKRSSSADVLGAAALGAGIVGAVAGLLVLGPGAWTYALDLEQWGVLAAIGITSFYIAPWMYFWAAAKTSIVVPAVLQALIPVFTLVLVVLLGLEHAPALAWVGVPLAFVGSVLAVVELPAPHRSTVTG
jgi:drug/metabolite transporter (DMT)-like permease